MNKIADKMRIFWSSNITCCHIYLLCHSIQFFSDICNLQVTIRLIDLAFKTLVFSLRLTRMQVRECLTVNLMSKKISPLGNETEKRVNLFFTMRQMAIQIRKSVIWLNFAMVWIWLEQFFTTTPADLKMIIYHFKSGQK